VPISVLENPRAMIGVPRRRRRFPGLVGMWRACSLAAYNRTGTPMPGRHDDAEPRPNCGSRGDHGPRRDSRAMTSRVPHWVQYLSGVVLIGLGILGIRESAHGTALLVWAVALIVGILLIVLPLRRARRKR